MKNVTKGKVIKGVALGVDVGAPLIATLTQFPVWIDKSAAATMSGTFVVFAMLSFVPLAKKIKAYFSDSPASWVMWAIFTAAMMALRSIIDQMAVICAIGLAANLSGAALDKLGSWLESKPDLNKAVDDIINEVQDNG